MRNNECVWRSQHAGPHLAELPERSVSHGELTASRHHLSLFSGHRCALRWLLPGRTELSVSCFPPRLQTLADPRTLPPHGTLGRLIPPDASSARFTGKTAWERSALSIQLV
ncbi:hypothetical protein EYF80_026944 [Liparis tanakae]|uniref:Uncharacterized protein n=1 Tax=Liparis tanakae TaxID=230148 RepID=A0A4Z2HAM9_9TELE|nr:hypothetical protein EYF80_026944 [Liparis tanakae]